MNLPGVADFVRVLAGWLILFGLAPLAIRRAGLGWPERLAVGFLESAFVVQVAVMILGDWRLCNPGTVFAVYLGWLVMRAADREALRRMWGGGAWRYRLSWLWTALDRRSGLTWRWRFPPEMAREQAIWLAAGAALALGLRFPLFNVRFLTEGSYERALSLQTLVYNTGWERDGSVALLAPLVFLTGVDAASVVRWSGPILSTLLALAAAYCAWICSHSRTVAVGAIALATAWVWWSSRGTWNEPGEVEIASLFWLLALAFLRGGMRWSLAAGLIGLTVTQHFPASVWPLFLLAMAALIAGRRIERAPLLLRRGIAMVGALGILALIAVDPPDVAADGPYQYEAAARVVDRIAREHPRRSWLVISPSHELPLLFGRGWHVELAEFVSSIPIEEAARPEFRLPYNAKHVFLFVEKRPLPQRLTGVPEDADSAVFAYRTQAGRQSLQFQAGRLAETYLASHPNTIIYYEDENVTVYHFRP
jgi:hypothetical protein